MKEAIEQIKRICERLGWNCWESSFGHGLFVRPENSCKLLLTGGHDDSDVASFAMHAMCESVDGKRIIMVESSAVGDFAEATVSMHPDTWRPNGQAHYIARGENTPLGLAKAIIEALDKAMGGNE